LPKDSWAEEAMRCQIISAACRSSFWISRANCSVCRSPAAVAVEASASYMAIASCAMV